MNGKESFLSKTINAHDLWKTIAIRIYDISPMEITHDDMVIFAYPGKFFQSLGMAIRERACSADFLHSRSQLARSVTNFFFNEPQTFVGFYNLIDMCNRYSEFRMQ